MSLSSNASLGALRLQAKQRADMENNPAISDPEWNNYLSNSYKELYDLLIGAYGTDYYIATPYQFNIGNSNSYPLPDGTSSYLNPLGGVASKFYKLAGVDLQYSAAPTGWVTLRNFEWIERNKYAYPNNAVNFNGYTNLKYYIQGNNLYFVPTPASGQLIQIWYAPAPTSLQFLPVCSTTLASTAVTSLVDITGLAAGMSVYGNGVPLNTVVSSINTTNNTFVLSNPCSSTIPVNVLQIWTDAAQFDGISGWEEYVIIDAAIKAGVKQENEVPELKMAKQDMKMRIEAMAEGRDMGQAHHVSDALSVNGGFSGGFDDQGGWGQGGS